jgi:hypothetical protein
MTRTSAALCLAAALATWNALAAGAPGVCGEPGFAAAVRPRTAAPAVPFEAGLRDEAFRLWEAAGFGLERSEHASWAVRAASGVAWQPWPSDRRDLRSCWLGPKPAGAVAIVHTHPAVVDPRPSANDRETAARLGIAIYAVSRSGIWKAEPGGGLTRVWDERWWAGCEARKHCRESVSVGVSIASAESPAPSETTAHPLRITE